MVKKVLALCDKEENYLRHMADYLEKKNMQPFMVRAFTDASQLKKFTEKYSAEILLIAENAYKDEIKDWPVKHILILNESGNQAGTDIENINKYQSSENVFRIIMNHLGENGLSGRLATGNRMKIIGNYTPIGRCMQTTFALSMGQILAKKHKTLYLNFESYSGFGHLLNREFAADITDVLYYFNCEREKLPYRLEGMIQTINGLDYIPPVVSYKDLEETEGKEWIELFREIERTSEYEYLILDLSDQLKGLFDVLRECFRVFTIIKEDGFAEAKVRQYEEVMKMMDYGDIAAKTKKWALPEFRRLPPGLEQLTHGEMAVCVREVIEKDIYAYEG